MCKMQPVRSKRNVVLKKGKQNFEKWENEE